MTDTLTSIFARVGADDSFDLVVGRSVTNPAIGRVFWDDQGPGNRGLVLRLDDAECDELPDDIDELSRMLARAGYRLDAQSVEELRAFVAERQ